MMPPLGQIPKRFSQEYLCNALDNISVPSHFAGGYQINVMDPKISVEDVGRIKLPLLEDQARQIISKARQAPYGKGSETIVDMSVQNTWELDPQNFKITASAEWDEWLNKVVLSQVAKVLGVTVPIHADLYKMLLYEKGAMFKAHTE
jgi:hypothetical protein